MSTLDRQTSAVAALVTFAFVGMHPANAAEPSKAATDEGTLNCQPRIQRIAVWSHGPRKKVLETPRYETRMRLVCKDEKKSEPKRVAAAPTFGPRSR